MPTRFPCWCRATYSYGGETKKDLGFVEGDLIEALNAGDGLWWMGRLRRDPRAIGLFPSNFVKILDESFQPTPSSRNASPSVQSQLQRMSPAKTSIFRKPFQAYEEIGKRSSLDNVQEREGTPESEKKNKFRPFSSMKSMQAPAGPTKRDSSGRPTPIQDENPFRVPAPPPRGGSRSPRPLRSGISASPTPVPGYAQPTTASMYRAASPKPGYSRPVSPALSRPHSPLPTTYHDGTAYPEFLPPSRQPSPSPSQQQFQFTSTDASGLQASRPPSPAPIEDDMGSSPPPPPPAHRVAYQPSRPTSPQHMYDARDYVADGGIQTPVPPSPGGDGSHMTPSPLRDAMNDVMSSLQDMSVFQESRRPARAASPPAVWSPDAYEITRTQSIAQQRAQSSLGFARADEYYRFNDSESRNSSVPSSRDGLPQLDTFVQRMERQLRHTQSTTSYSSDNPPMPPPKGAQHSSSRPTTSSSYSSQDSWKGSQMHSQQQHPQLRHRKSAYELGREGLNRTYTTKTNTTNSTETSSATRSSNSTQLTSRSVMSGQSAGGFSATSAGSLARRKFGFGSQKGKRPLTTINTKSTPEISSSARSMVLSESSGSNPSYHQSHDSSAQALLNPTADWFCDPMVLTPSADWSQDPMETAGVFGGLGAPKAKKSNFFKKMIDTARTTARTGAANARSTIGSRPGSRGSANSPTKGLMSERGVTSISGGLAARPGSAAGDMGFGGGSDWMQVRRDVNRSNSLSRKEHDERAERCQMLDIPVLSPIDQFQELVEGDEGLDGLPVAGPTDFNLPNLALVDKSTRFLQGVPPRISAAALAQNYVCRQYRSDVQRLRAIFTWTAERIAWEEDFEGGIDTRRAVQSRHGCSEEIAVVVREMCSAVGIHSEVIHGYLKAPGEVVELDTLARPNHWWNAVIIDGEWRILDCSLSNPTNPRRSAYSSASGQVAETWYFLTRPVEVCYTHIPLLPEQQHIVPSVPYEILVALPCACPTYFRHSVELTNFETSILHLENLEMAHLHINVPEDVECVAETEAKAFARDGDGDVFESGDTVKKRAFAQPEWVSGRKRFTIKALLPGDEGFGVLKIYAGKRGLMHSIKDNPHSLALTLALSHHGQNPPYEFATKHPTPHAQRHDLYVVSPQCSRLVMNNTFVFCVRQHPSSLSRFTPDTWGSGNQARPTSPNPYARPTSAMSMVSATVSQSGSNYSDGSSNSGQPMTAAQQKPAKLAIQSPSQKIIRLTRKQEHSSRHTEEDQGLTTSWETVVKIGERGTWRGLVLADRSARWCVFAEWECV